MDWDYRKPGTRICVCFDVSNDDALEAWRIGDDPSVEQLTRLFHCGRRCSLCIPLLDTLLSEFKAGCWPAKE
ncbi:MAG: (2Fe-2S)-binding protein [Planctomycetes bacterium]|nr:(2Fe-2S)-binding protein [Planctomycetota bacterium]